MSEEAVIRWCSPTLAGIKTGNMFRCNYGSECEMRDSLRCLNCRLACKGLRFLPLEYNNGSALVYVYRPSMLRLDLCDQTACRILRERGYCPDDPDMCVRRLISRLKERDTAHTGDYPHEIGFFLGYPPEDVRGFIEHRDRGCKRVGCWKVYGDVQSAEKTFAKYDRCTEVYRRKWAQGRSVERLIVG